MRDEVAKDLARLMLAYVGTFIVAVVAQKYCGAQAISAFRKAKSQAPSGKGETPRFNRYSGPYAEMSIAGDRAVGNWVEWAPVFVILAGLTALVADGEGLSAGWLYVAARALYPVLAVTGGIKQGGAKPRIFLATAPMYIALIYLASKIYSHL